MRSALVLHGLLQPEAVVEEDLLVALHAWLRRRRAGCSSWRSPTSSATGACEPAGNLDEYPNWRVPLTDPAGRLVPLEAVLTDERARRLAAVMSGRD